jgi:hypothetical protein
MMAHLLFAFWSLLFLLFAKYTIQVNYLFINRADQSVYKYHINKLQTPNSKWVIAVQLYTVMSVIV